jgi:hypothetical protein
MSERGLSHGTAAGVQLRLLAALVALAAGAAALIVVLLLARGVLG